MQPLDAKLFAKNKFLMISGINSKDLWVLANKLSSMAKRAKRTQNARPLATASPKHAKFLMLIHQTPCSSVSQWKCKAC
jgi:hypothetical protein